MQSPLLHLLIAAAGLSVLLTGSESNATPIGPSCGTCQGSVYDLTYDPIPVATTATTETWRITLSIDTSGYSGSGEYLTTVAIKVSSAFEDATLVSAPGLLGYWHEMSGGLAAAGCSGSGSGFDCVAFQTFLSLAPSVPGGTYTWVFEVEVANGALFTGTGEASIKGRYVNSSGAKVGALVSEGITLSETPEVPEPAAAALLAVAALGLAATRRGATR
jgi:hypothetical protein